MRIPTSSQRLNPINMYRYAPLRTPAWRWGLAEKYAAPCRRLPSGHHEPAFAAAVDYLRRKRRAKRADTADRAHPMIAAALNLHEADGPPRWEIEARLLAGETSEAIAQRVGLDAAVVEWFHDLFFDVREMLGATDWICASVLQLRIGAIPEPAEPTIWKYFGFGGGPLLVDVLAGDHLGRPAPDWPERARLARQARTSFQLHWGTYKAAAQALDRGRKLFPEVGEHDPMWRMHRLMIDLAAGRRLRTHCSIQMADEELSLRQRLARRRRRLHRRRKHIIQEITP